MEHPTRCVSVTQDFYKNHIISINFLTKFNGII